MSHVRVGTWLTLANSAMAELVGASGFDWVVLDMEHSAFSLRELENLLCILNLSKVEAYIRVPSPDYDLIRRLMDLGADGVVIPNVVSADQVDNAISGMYYPPKGKRGVGLARAQKYGLDFDRYFHQDSKGKKLFVQIENVEALPKLNDIFSKPISGYFIGPYDLTCSMGITAEFENTRYLEVLENIKRIAKDHDIPSGIHLIEPNFEQLSILAQDYQYIAFSVDFKILCSAYVQSVKLIGEINEKRSYHSSSYELV